MMLLEIAPLWQRAQENWDLFVDAGLLYGIAAHAVNTFPVPDNPFWRWLLGCFQFAFAFRGRASNTFQNQDTATVSVPKKNGNGGNGGNGGAKGTGTGNGGTGNGGSITGQNPIPGPSTGSTPRP